MADVSWLWRNQEMADVRLVLVQEEPAPGDSECEDDEMAEPSAKRHKVATEQCGSLAVAGTGERVLEELVAHRIVLGSASGFLKAQLLRWDQQHIVSSLTTVLTVTYLGQVQLRLEPATQTAPVSLLSVTVPAGQLPAALLLLELMYKWTMMSWPASAARVMQMAVLADQWEALRCLDFCMQHLANLPPEQLTTADIAQLMASELPGPIVEHAAHCGMLSVCCQRLLQLFGDVRAVVISGQLRTDFCSLPYAAVKLWAEQDDLTVDSENSVVVLLTHWWLANSGRVTAVQQCELAGRVRLSHLSTCYKHLLTIECDAGWFKPDPIQLNKFLWACNHSIATSSPVPTKVKDALPAAWFKPPRIVSQEQPTLQWEVHTIELRLLHDNAVTGLKNFVSPQGLYWAGYTWQLFLSLESQKSALVLAVRTQPAPGLDQHLFPPLGMSMSTKLATRKEGASGYSNTQDMASAWFDPVAGMGSSTLLSVPDTASPRPNSRPPDNLMIDGKLWLLLTLKTLK